MVSIIMISGLLEYGNFSTSEKRDFFSFFQHRFLIYYSKVMLTL